MKHMDQYLPKIESFAKRHGVNFIRLFGSAVDSLDRANDVDLLIDSQNLTMENRLAMASELEDIFQKKVDLITLYQGINPLLVLEIASHSVPVFESSSGREIYANLIDRYHAVAIDEKLRMSSDEIKEIINSRQKELKGVV
jgi:predicted nucleotidyltransferase